MRTAALSVETGHFYNHDLVDGPKRLAKHFGVVALNPWLRSQQIRTLGGDEPGRLSMCILVDDYHQRPSSNGKPLDTLRPIIAAAESEGVRIDYIGREAGCVKLAAATSAILQRSTGFRNDKGDSYWLVAKRPTVPHQAAMAAETPPISYGQPPIAVDIEFWSKPSAGNNYHPWACPLLAATWQMVRLGGLEQIGGKTAMDDPHGFNNPFLLDDNPPDWDTWDEVPALLQLRVDAAPFAGERVASIIPADFLAVECAVDMLRRDIAHTLGEPMLANPIGREFYSV